MPKKLNLQFGALADPVDEQLKAQGLFSHKSIAYELQAHHITSLNLDGLLTDAEALKARKRLLKKITAEVQPYE